MSGQYSFDSADSLACTSDHDAVGYLAFQLHLAPVTAWQLSVAALAGGHFSRGGRWHLPAVRDRPRLQCVPDHLQCFEPLMFISPGS